MNSAIVSKLGFRASDFLASMGQGKCLFCKIARKEASAQIVGERDAAVAFRDIHPKAPVHILVVPRAHYASLAEMNKDATALLGDLLLFAANIARQEHLSGYRVVINVGREGGQIVDHVHFHILGGWNGGTPKVEV